MTSTSHRMSRSAAAACRWRAVLLGLWAAAEAGCGPEPMTPVAVSASSASSEPAPANPPDSGGPADPRASWVSSQMTTWTCTGSPCPWGSSLSNHALVWPAGAGASSARLGYSASAGVYLPAARANGADISLETGTARVHAGPPGDPSHRVLATITAGQMFHVAGLAAGEVLSVQADSLFTYRLTLPPPSEPERREPERREPERHAHGPGGPRGPVLHAIPARWQCNHTPGCFSAPWTGSVIAWPAWAAYQSNGRSGNVLRFVFSTRGEPLYPYMGPWAQGCEVTAESGTPKVVEWKRGSEQWRQTVLQPGQSHVISLVPPEDGALIEGPDDSSTFSVSLRNCTPQRIEP